MGLRLLSERDNEFVSHWVDSSPDVTVICTVKDGLPYLIEAVGSLAGQTLGDWQLIVIDDGSQDGSVAALSAMEKSDLRIETVQTPGIGRSRALNLAITRAKAPAIVNLDSDDILHPRALDVLLKALNDNPGMAGLSSRHVTFFGSSNPKWPNANVASSVRNVTSLLSQGNPLVHSGMAMRRELLVAMGGYSTVRTGNIDYELWIRMAEAGHQLGVLESHLVARRIHRRQSYERVNPKKYRWESIKLQHRAIRNLGGGLRAWTFLVAKLVWGMSVPYSLQRRIRVLASRQLHPLTRKTPKRNAHRRRDTQEDRTGDWE